MTASFEDTPNSKENIPLDVVCKDIFDKTFESWKSLDWTFPNKSDQKDICIKRNNSFIIITPQFSYKDRLKICDVDIPDDLQPILKAYAQKNKYRNRAFLPGPDITLDLYGKWPITPEEDIYGLLKVEESYTKWFYITHTAWSNLPPKLEGWGFHITSLDFRDNYNFYFFPNKHLRCYEMRKSISNPERYAYTRLYFRSNKLVSFWLDVPNGTLFPDPRGSKDNIWPYWITNVHDKKLRPTETDWEHYIKSVRNKEKVLSGRTLKMVFQTEQQAKENLERWRNFIYYKSRQAIYFRKTPNKDFKSEIGHLIHGKFGVYISKNPQTHRLLSLEETIENLTNYYPSNEFL